MVCFTVDYEKTEKKDEQNLHFFLVVNKKGLSLQSQNDKEVFKIYMTFSFGSSLT